MFRSISVLLLVLVLAVASTSSARADSKSGQAKFTGPRKEKVMVELGDKLKLKAEFQMIEVGPAGRDLRQREDQEHVQ